MLGVEAIEALQRLTLPAQYRLFVVSPSLPDDFRALATLAYRDICADNASAQLFWQWSDSSERAQAWRQVCATSCVGVLLSTRGDVLRCGGVFLVTDIIPGESATGSVWYAQKGPAALGWAVDSVSHAVMGWIFEAFALERLYADTIFPEACTHFIRACGARIIQETPAAVYYGGAQRTLWRLVAERPVAAPGKGVSYG
jgi:hypothetical protein